MVVATRRLVANLLVVSAELDGEAVLLNVESGIYFGLDPVGARIWALLVEAGDPQGAASEPAGTTPEAIVAVLLEEYDVTAEQASRDTAALLDALAAHGLILAADCG